MKHYLHITYTLLLVLSGCGTAPPAEAPLTGCAKLKSTCLVDQQGCVEDGAGIPSCVPCAEGKYAALTGACEPIGEGPPLLHDFKEFTVKAGEEVSGLCQSWTMNNPTELWVNGVELMQDQASHHSNWTFVPSNKFDGPDGVWRCRERSYNQLDGALSGGVLYAQSTQAPREVQRFPNGAAVRIPPYSRIIGDVHLLNASSKSVTGRARIRIYTLPSTGVKVRLVPFHYVFHGLAIPPKSYSRHQADCWTGDNFETANNQKWDMQIYYILPHTHSLGRRLFMDVLGGPLDGKSIFDVSGFNGEAHGRAYDPPIDLSGSSGIRFGCEFENPRDEVIKYGIGDQEMCELLGFAASKMAFESQVLKSSEAPPDGTTKVMTGPCADVLFPWDWNKPGGPGPK